MNKRVILLGDMGVRFGKEWSAPLNSSLSDIIRLIDCQTPDFKRYLIEALELGLDACILSGDTIIEEPEELLLDNNIDEVVYISLVPCGSGGLGKILAGILIVTLVLVSGGFFGAAGGFGTPLTGWAGGFAGQVALSLGVGLMMQGITEMMTKAPGTEADTVEGTSFSGPSNNTKSGQAVPILYGRSLVGGTAVSIDYKTAVTSPYSGGYINPYGLYGFNAVNGIYTQNYTPAVRKEGVC